MIKELYSYIVCMKLIWRKICYTYWWNCNFSKYLCSTYFYRRSYGQRIPLGWPGSNPGRPRELVETHVAMSRCTNWPPKWSTNMVIDYCRLNIQSCMIYFCVRSNVLIKMICHTCMLIKCTTIYDHICISLFRSILFALLQSYHISAKLRRFKLNFKWLVKVAFFETKSWLVSNSKMIIM